MKLLILLVIVTILIIVILYNRKSSSNLFKAILKGSSEVPPNKSEAIGTATLTFDKETKVFILTVNYSIALKVTSAHIHRGPIGVSGPIIFTLDHTKNPIKYTSHHISASQEADLKANMYYVDIHTEDYPHGEIRGQLVY